MIQCSDCEYYRQDADGKRVFACDPFTNIKEPECLTKWQLLRLEMLASGYKGMLGQQQKMAPMQDKIMRYIERELEDLDESDKWKSGDDEDESDNEGPIL